MLDSSVDPISSGRESQDVSDVAATTRLLRSASSMVERAVALALEPIGLTSAQFEVLSVMAQAEAEQLGCTEIGKRLAGRASDVTRLLDRLESVALVARKRDENDRRVVHTVLTEKGRDVLREAAPAVQNAERMAFSGLSGDDRAVLNRLLVNVQSAPVG